MKFCSSLQPRCNQHIKLSEVGEREQREIPDAFIEYQHKKMETIQRWETFDSGKEKGECQRRRGGGS